MSKLPHPIVDPPQVRRRCRFTPEQKRALLDEARLPGHSISEVARRYRVAPSQMFQWRRAMHDATKTSLKSNERVVPESQVRELEKRVKRLERLLGRKTEEVEILQEAIKIAKEKKWLSGDACFNKESGP